MRDAKSILLTFLIIILAVPVVLLGFGVVVIVAIGLAVAMPVATLAGRMKESDAK
jgi:uncharacterized membrane protein